jgi:DNA-binding NarL/FixJ family response regulator
VVREGLTTLLALVPGVEVVGAAADGGEALTMAIQLRPDVVLMDLRIPHCDGVEATRRLRDHDAGIKGLGTLDAACLPPSLLPRGAYCGQFPT